MEKCPVCNWKVIKVEDISLDIEKHVFILKGERCTRCKEEFLYEEETHRVILAARGMGIWSL